MRHLVSFASCIALAACAHPSAGTTPAPHAAHARSHRARALGGPQGAALDAASTRAEACLRGEDSVAVEGSFDGATGHFNVVRAVGVATTDEDEQCVTEAFESAHVPPFTDVAPEESWFVTPRGISADEREARYRVVHGHGSDEDLRGAIDTAAVSATLARENAAVRRCYDDLRASTPGLAGSLRVRLRIGLDGHVQRARSEGAAALRPVGECVVARLRALEWPHPRRAAVTFLLPFSFRPES